MSWKVKDGGALQIFGFPPDSSQPTYQDITLTIPGGGTYSLVGSSSYGVVKTSTTLANLDIVDGQSSVSGSNDPVNLADLNDYLDDVRASRPFGPITTDSDNIIGVGEAWVYTASYTLVSGDLLTGQVDNIAEVSATSSLGTAITVQSSATGNTTSTGSVTSTTFASLSSLFISKTAALDTEVVGGANDTTVDVGDQITYTVTVSNTGNTVLSNVVVSDTLSRVAADNTATTVVSTATTPALLGTATDNDGTTSGATMNPNEQWVYTYTYTLTQDDIDAGCMSNLASVTDGSLYIESMTAGNTDTSVLTGAAPSGSPTVTSLPQSPEMLVKKVTDLTVSGATYLTGNNSDIVDQDASGTVSVGDRVYFTITVKNTGNVTLSSVSLADTLTTNEAAPTTLSMTSGPTLTADTGTTGDGNLAVGDLWTYSGYYALTQSDIDLGVGIKNLATFTATPPIAPRWLQARRRPSPQRTSSLRTTSTRAACRTPRRLRALLRADRLWTT
ncbi:DUF11 domain-containing protein [Marivivens donghaensis]|uniref:DUF11 domain-containing protein n=1 Tax=Marivivens donghaensis TaxID=1699413 RepID=A0ABX0VSH6_9RHOB|nr:DUF11 domain-containing protein [Marivivens donghaensis]